MKLSTAAPWWGSSVWGIDRSPESNFTCQVCSGTTLIGSACCISMATITLKACRDSFVSQRLLCGAPGWMTLLSVPDLHKLAYFSDLFSDLSCALIFRQQWSSPQLSPCCPCPCHTRHIRCFSPHTRDPLVPQCSTKMLILIIGAVNLSKPFLQNCSRICVEFNLVPPRGRERGLSRNSVVASLIFTIETQHRHLWNCCREQCPYL